MFALYLCKSQSQVKRAISQRREAALHVLNYENLHQKDCFASEQRVIHQIVSVH